MPPNQAAYVAFFTPGVASICCSRLYGSICVIDRREATTSRFAPATLPPELNATRTESSIPNSRNAATTDNNVSDVRVLLRNNAAQTRWKYFIASLPSGVLQLFDQVALVQVQRVRRVLGGLRIVGHHDDRLAVVAVEHLQQAQDFLGRMPVEVAGGFVADQQGRVGHDRARDGHALLLATGEFRRAMLAAILQAHQFQC